MKNLRYFFCFPQGGFNDFCEIIWISLEYCKKFNRILVIDTRFIITFKDDFRKYIIINDQLVYTDDIDILFENLKISNSTFFPKFSSSLSFFKNTMQISSKFVWTKRSIYYENIRCSFELDREYDETILFYSTVKGGSNISKLLEISTIETSLKNKIQMKYLILAKDYIAIHVRNTDYSSNFVKFQEDHHSYLLKNKNIFLATDDYKVVEYFKKKYKEKLFHFSTIPNVKIQKNKGFHYDNNIVTAKTMIEDCISDFFLCCLGSEYYYSCKESSFSKNIEFIRKNNENVMNLFYSRIFYKTGHVL